MSFLSTRKFELPLQKLTRTPSTAALIFAGILLAFSVPAKGAADRLVKLQRK